MKRLAISTCMGLALVLAAAAYADRETPHLVRSESRGFLTSEGGNPAKAGGDTICLIGPAAESGVQAIGTFQDAAGNPDWNGWTHADLTRRTTSHWQASTYFAVAGIYSAWCGEDIPSCGAGDPDGGYDNDYDEMIEWRGTVADNTASCTVRVTATLRHDIETGYDFVYLSNEKLGQGFTDVVIQTGAGILNIDRSFTYQPGDYLGGGRDEVVVLFRVTSDGVYSDGDCAAPSSGACQLDDVAIGLTNGAGYATDFEDGTLGEFTVRFRPGVGDFAQLWTGLEDLDPCATDYSAQAAFIDDGVVVPGTGGTPCVNWCYGPNGYIVNTTGGLAGPEAHISNVIDSPVVAWVDPAHNGAQLQFDLYRHEDLGVDAPGILAFWSVRSADTDAGESIEQAEWRDRGFGTYGGPSYDRQTQWISDLLVPGCDEVQVRLGVFELGWGYFGNDGYPAPYFDNVRLITYPAVGPTMTASMLTMANDNFIEQDGYDAAQPGSNHVRFDMALNIAWASHLRNDPGDSLVIDCSPTRMGAALTGNPRMHYSLKRNPLFDPYRSSGLPDRGYVLCDSVRGPTGDVVANRFCADLPDTGFLFPGDRIRYYFRAEDTDGVTPQWSILPGDTTGYSDWTGAKEYFLTMRALPTITDLATGAQPEVLVWYDVGGIPVAWDMAFANLGLIKGRDYDEFVTNFPSNPSGNGLGGRASYGDIMGYGDMVYTSGSSSAFTITDGNWDSDPTSDARLLTDWLFAGGKDLLLTGDGLATDLAQSGAVTTQLLDDYLGVTVTSADIRPLIASQSAPRVLCAPGNPVFVRVDSWIAFGGCAHINSFDAVQPSGAAQPIAEFATPAGVAGGYPYSAATLNHVEPGGTRVISVPYDFTFIHTDPDEATPPGAFAGRTRLLADVLAYFGIDSNPGDASPVPAAGRFALGSHPNPFNPCTTIRYTVARPGRLTLKIYNLRGELVKTLLDGHVETSSTLVWDGSDQSSCKVASGIYFCEARMGGEVRVSKMVLVK